MCKVTRFANRNRCRNRSVGKGLNMEDMEDLLHYLHCWTLFPDIPAIKHKLYKNIANYL